MDELRSKLDAYRGGISLAVIGAAGTGKSSLLGSIGTIFDPEEILLLAPKPREINSWKYRDFGITETAEVFQDTRWRPSLDMYEADAFLKMERRLLELYEDTQYKVIILDPYTDVVSAASHDLLKVDKAATPRDSSDSRGFYGSLKHKLDNFTKTLVGLSSPALSCPKHVLVSVHAQPAKEGEKEGGAGVSFEGDVMPMIEGSHRHSFGSEFDILCYSRIKHSNKVVAGKMQRSSDYIVQVSADPKRHAKVAIAERMERGEFPNDLREMLTEVFRDRQVEAAYSKLAGAKK